MLLDGKANVAQVEDDPQLAKLVRTYFQMEGYDTLLAANREEINAALRQQPKPDVMLPDIDGFDVLARVRQHDAVKDILKGLQIDVLLKAVKTVAGL